LSGYLIVGGETWRIFLKIYNKINIAVIGVLSGDGYLKDLVDIDLMIMVMC
jgi:hypothetical protein